MPNPLPTPASAKVDTSAVVAGIKVITGADTDLSNPINLFSQDYEKTDGNLATIANDAPTKRKMPVPCGPSSSPSSSPDRKKRVAPTLTLRRRTLVVVKAIANFSHDATQSIAAPPSLVRKGLSPTSSLANLTQPLPPRAAALKKSHKAIVGIVPKSEFLGVDFRPLHFQKKSPGIFKGPN